MPAFPRARRFSVFYTLDQKPSEKPHLTRTDQCLECHASSKNLGVPGHLVRSFVTDEDGVVDLAPGISPVTHRTPLAERWGGWYVTGTHGAQVHRGNLIGKAAFARQEKEPNYRGNVVDLSRFFDTSRYLTPHSDIVALTAPIRGTSGFSEWFATQGPTDPHGRSLRQFDLTTRLFKYPCSFLIYSEAFQSLPAPIKDQIYHRLWEILTGRDTQPEFARISPETKRAILEILAATQLGLPAYWTKPS